MRKATYTPKTKAAKAKKINNTSSCQSIWTSCSGRLKDTQYPQAISPKMSASKSANNCGDLFTMDIGIPFNTPSNGRTVIHRAISFCETTREARNKPAPSSPPAKSAG